LIAAIVLPDAVGHLGEGLQIGDRDARLLVEVPNKLLEHAQPFVNVA
jgi:hypothetical protein